ncbi:hypothetical protein HYU11_03320 [Candidatus Woesearchaeota archaeon]|nr:hypothetical protein [Candidatus Woesearchaeota archaeon]
MLDSLGVLDSLLPFLLIFTIIYAILNKTKIIGEGRKNFNVIVALTLSLMVVIPHITGRYPNPQSDPVVIINTAIPNISVIIVAILAVLLIIGIFGKNLDIAGTSLAGWVGIGAFIAVAWIFGSAAGFFGEGFLALPAFLQDPDTQALIVMILVFGLIIMFITSEREGPSVTGGLGKLIDGIGRSIK